MTKLVSKKNLQKLQNEVGFEMVKQMNRELHEENENLKKEILDLKAKLKDIYNLTVIEGLK